MKRIALLKGDVKHYDWGGTNYIPSLLKTENKNNEPYAEYWMGVHPQANGMITFDKEDPVSFKQYVADNASAVLRPDVYKNFGTLPFLLKVLDVKKMLSIQVHPSKKQAAIDFEAENKAGVALDAPDRNYKDANHKPELMVAMSDFYLLHGFKPEASMVKILDKTEELKPFKEVFEKGGYQALYKMAMEMPQDEVNKMLKPLLDKIIPLYENGSLQKDDENFWAARAALTFNKGNDIDRGIFSIYFFNLLHLEKGEAIFQDAGVPHAYLEGLNVEIMASSDNVLRGGLTPKHINTKELLKHTRCEATYPHIIVDKRYKVYKDYKTPAKDFELSSYRLNKGEQISLSITGTEIFLLLKGNADFMAGEEHVALGNGNIAAVAFPGGNIDVKANEVDTLIFRASVPQ